MARPRIGSVTRHGDHFDIRITLPNGSRSKPMCQPPDMSEARARDKAMRLTEIAAKRGPTAKRTAKGEATPPGETFDAWSERWCAAREARGLTSVDDDRGRLRNWVSPQLGGGRPMAEITRRDLEALVEKLDTDVQAGALEWKTARNVWGTVSKAFGDACHSKSLALRILTENPAEHVRGPDRGAEKAKVYLFPSEFLRLVSCERIPLRWRRIYALATYTYTRAGELRALDWADVDFLGGYIHIHKSLTEKGKIKPTKTKETRKIPIEPNLLPLLRAMHQEAKGDGAAEPTGRVLSVPQKKAAQELQVHLRRADITRADLSARDESRKRLSFHDASRATGATWMALRGDDPLKIQRRLGHADFNTTQIYIREAEALGPDVGTPFPPLPPALLGGAGGGGFARSSAREGAPRGEAPGTTEKSWRGGRDSNTGGEGRVDEVPREIAEAPPAAPSAMREPNSAMSGALAEPCQNPRAQLAADLAASVARLMGAGDTEGARLAHETLGRLLAVQEPAPSGSPVVSLAAARRRRGGG